MRNLILCLLIAVQFGCNPQIHQRHFDESKEQILSLKEKGALVVRLGTKAKTRAVLTEKGFTARAENIRKESLAFNQELMKAFKDEFDFCPVYFIDDTVTKQVKEEGFKKDVFLNENLEIDNSIECTEPYILTVEYGETTADTTSRFAGHYIHKGDNGAEQRDAYQANDYIELTGLIMKSDYFIQLNRPFPYYVREHTMVVLSRGKHEMVSMLNKNLKQFYEEQK